MKALRVLRTRGEAISARVRDEVAAVLDQDASPGARIRAARRAHAALDAATRRTRSLAFAPACGAGCSSCCHVHVDATEPEILAVAAHLHDRVPEDALEAFLDRLAQHVTQVEALSDDERWAARIPCALLAPDGRCTVYPVRPMRCRAFHSSDAGACRDALHGRAAPPPPTIPALDRAHAAVEEGYDRALAGAGLSTAPERLEVGLLAALRAS